MNPVLVKLILFQILNLNHLMKLNKTLIVTVHTSVEDSKSQNTYIQQQEIPFLLPQNL